MHDDTTALLESVLDSVADAGGAGAVYGDPIERGDRTVIPVARVAWGFGGGGGEEPNDGEDGDSNDEAAAGSSGFGFGGGLSASPVGALEVTDDETRFVRYGGEKKLVVAAALAFLAGVLLGRR